MTLIQVLGRRAVLEPTREAIDRFRAGLAFLVGQVRPDVLYMGGGLSERADLRACSLDAFPSLPIVWSRDGRFVGEAGGRSIGGPSAIVFDVGQTAIKVSHPGRRRVHDRPQPEFDDDGCDRAGIAFIKNVLSSELTAAEPEAPVVLAVPGDLKDDLTPGLSSFRWQNRTGLLRQLLEPAGNRDVLVLNDAELAAESARLEVAPSLGRLCLVVTLGHAPGGALLTRAAETLP
jgi:predicted NBD/HSP70 family sugar kinase